MTIDPITLEVVTEGLISVVREMRATVFRTARSVAIYEARDFSCGLFDASGQVVAQSEDIGSHLVPLPWSVEAALAYMGGAVPGSMSGTATKIYQECMRIPPVKIVEEGRINQPLMEVLLSNMRVREERLGGFNSGLTACRTAERRLGELIERYGVDLMLDCVRLNLDRSEARMRENIKSLPDGTYYYEDYLETFGPDGFEPLLLPLTIAGDALTADFTGVSPQVPVPVNSTLAVTAASVLITLKSVLDPDHALNHGSFRPVEVIAPEGTIVNVSHPAPAGSHGEIRKRVIATMLGALARACPELVSGDIHRTSFHNLIGGIDPETGREYVHYEWACGGNGGFLEADGPSAMAAIDWGDLTTAQSTEVLESQFPLHVEFSELGVDSGGPGKHRGGLGMRRALKLTRGIAKYSLLADGAMMPPFGILGGESGAPVDSYVIKADGTEHRFDSPGKVGGHPLEAGDTVILQSAGGGYGDPRERDPEAVARDVADGVVSAEAAQTVYRTDAVKRHAMAITEKETGSYIQSGPSKKRVIRIHPTDAAALGVLSDDRVELIGSKDAPLRAWVLIDRSVNRGTIFLDQKGALATNSEVSQRIQIKHLYNAS